jgi:mycofactocin precursor
VRSRYFDVVQPQESILTMMIQPTEKNHQTRLSPATEVMDRVQEPRVAQLRAKEAEALAEKPRILEEVVIEEVSIDGMCGVY